MEDRASCPPQPQPQPRRSARSLSDSRALMRGTSFALFGLLTAVLCAAGDVEERPANLRRLVKSLDFQVQASTSRESPAFCRRVLAFLTTATRKPMQPSAASESFNQTALAPYANYCPGLDIREYESPEGLPYKATGTFRIFAIPRNLTNRDGETHFMMFAQSYFNSFVKEQFRANPKIYPYAGFAWPDGNGGGAIYSIINQTSCSFEDQLVVHGEYNHVAAARTPHFSEPFIFRNALYVYDFHNYVDDDRNYAGLVIWSLDSPGQPRQMCVYDSADSRAQLAKALESSKKSPERSPGQ